MSNKLYAERDIEGLDEDGNFYFKHVMAMTAEGLHSKSAIAAELGYRDSKIVELQSRLERANGELNEMAATVEALRGSAIEAAEALGFLSHHLHGRMGEAALMDMAEKADALNDALEAIPRQHLRGVRAEAVIDAIKSCVVVNCIGTNCISVRGLKQYAERVRAGEK